jgi:formate/nitrite transporter FocA (FNT family)
VQQAFLELGREAMAPPFSEKILHGIFAGWLIALLVWTLGAAATRSAGSRSSRRSTTRR